MKHVAHVLSASAAAAPRTACANVPLPTAALAEVRAAVETARHAEPFRQAPLPADVEAARIDMQACGESRPAAASATADGWRENRRVELLVSNGEGRFDAAR